MIEFHSYTAIAGSSRVSKRNIVRIEANAKKPQEPEVNRTFVPFSGFDGQALAGTGALVFEGELLEIKN